MRKAGFFLVCLAIFKLSLYTSCHSSPEAEEKTTDTIVSEISKTNVDVVVLGKDNFTREIISNGRLRARQKSRLSFGLGEELLKINVINGQYVKAGDTLAVINSQKLQIQKGQAEIRLLRAKLDLEDILLGRGFTLSDSLKVPNELMQMANIRSGYSEAVSDLERICADIQKSVITAPFNGLIADLDVYVHEQVSPGKEFCVIIDNSSFLVEFPIMESELFYVSKGKNIEIRPFSKPGKKYSGEITSINPVVDDNGQIKVTALIQNTESLKEGMNVRVFINDHVPNQLVVPKSAVIYRDNLEVLFRYVNGKAYWTYVNTLMENSSYYAVRANPERTAFLNEGDTIIISNNLNLAHGSKVRLMGK